MPATLTLDNFAASPCSNPGLGLDEALAAYARLGYSKFEAFTSWAKSALDIDADPKPYLEAARRHSMRFTSVHLPPVEADHEETINRAVRGARFAKGVGANVAIFKATDRKNYIAGAAPFLDGITGLGITPVLQNHVGTPISTLDDYAVIIDGIGDARMKTTLEVGMFHAIGVGWREAADLLGDSIALVHIKDQIGERRVPFGHGDVDFRGLFAWLEEAGYTGDIVVEMEVCSEDTQRTLELLGDARRHIQSLLAEIHG